MSYDIYLTRNGETVTVPEKHHVRGGTYQVGGSHKLHLNITYNYSTYFVQALGPGGIRSLYGQTASEAAPRLASAIMVLGIQASEDYWEATSGNAGKALLDLLGLCAMAPDALIEGD